MVNYGQSIINYLLISTYEKRRVFRAWEWSLRTGWMTGLTRERPDLHRCVSITYNNIRGLRVAQGAGEGVRGGIESIIKIYVHNERTIL